MGKHSPIHPLKLKKVYATEHLLQFLNASRISSPRICRLVETYKNLEEPTSYDSTIKM
jgi:hypothetical protein